MVQHESVGELGENLEPAYEVRRRRHVLQEINKHHPQGQHENTYSASNSEQDMNKRNTTIQEELAH